MLASDDPAKIASCVISAEAWASDGEDLEIQMKREIDAFRLGFKACEDQEYQQAAAAHREKLSKQYGVTTSFQERRRRQMEAVKPRDGDHAGGPVTWNGGQA